MDIALKTLVLIIFILVPGFIFRRVYFQGTFSKQFDSKSWSHSLFYSALFGIILNFIAYYYYEYLFSKIDYTTCLSFYNSITKESIPEKDIQAFNIESVYKYLGILYILSVIIPWLIYLIIRNLKLDRYFEPLRFANHWHYYFKGEIKDFKEFSLAKGKCSAATVDVLVKSEKDGNNLYSGLLSSYSLDNNGTLDSILLTQAQIFKKESGIFKDIHSTVFIIPNSNISNINIRYTFEEKDDTVIDFITVTIFIGLLIFFWFDFKNIFTDYNLVSKIFIKILVTAICFLFSFFIESTYEYLRYDIKLTDVPQNSTVDIIEIINNDNIRKQSKIIELRNNFLGSFILVSFLFIVLIIILYFTY